MGEANVSGSRVEALLADMSLAEKVGQLVQYFYFQLPEQPAEDGAIQFDMSAQPKGVEAALAEGGAGSMLFVTRPAVVNRLQRLAIEGSPHDIPAIFGFDVIHGLRTILPVPLALAASWDADVIERGQAVAAREARAVGIHWTFAPMVDIARDPRWGRMIEGAGEDPHLGSVVAAAQVRGFQGDHLGAAEHVIAGPKHYAGYGAALGGRDYDETDISDQEFWNVYLPPFAAAVAAGAGNIMSAYMDLNGVPATGNKWLLSDVLRDELGFEGFVVSDANSVKDLETHHYAADQSDAAVRALNAGLDMEMAISEAAYTNLVAAVESGRVPIELVDRSVRRVLAAKEALGLFDQPFVDEAAAEIVLAAPEHREVAREAAEASAVLLRNEGSLLPLSTEVSRVAVVGYLADSKRDTIGPWVFDYDLAETVTVLDGIRAHLGDSVQVDYAPGVPTPTRLYPSMFDMFGDGTSGVDADFDAEAEFARAVQVATEAEVAIVVLGENQDMIGEAASRSSLDLPGEQLALLKAVVATGTPTVLVLMNGRPLDLSWAAEHVPAILDIWYPGTQGGTAAANLLFGAADPRGRLPFTWPRSIGQVPIHHAVTRGHSPQNQHARYWNEEHSPLFPFGYGLSYAEFSYGEVDVTPASVPLDGQVEVSVDVTNTSERAGQANVQLYLHQRYGTSSRPLRQLKAFQLVQLAAGETKRVVFSVGPDERRYWSSATHGYVLDETVFDVWVGSDASASAAGTFTVAG
ncbi:MAG TPA: glycoside hydrolase family 3 N-terminal domain-containing protein [Propionicimonas sp.]|nr:glycoside hydrolase family 3 N-terminal domain-containing protein [Propionicimonas sp.]